MKLKIKKDINLRKKLFFLEKKLIILKYIVKNIAKYSLKRKELLKKIRFILATKIKLFKDNKTKMVRRCVLTGRSRSSTRILNISRIKMRELIKNKVLKNIKKRSW
jgi:ribosomal protein S14